MGRKVKGGNEGRGNLVSPTRLRPLVGVDIRFVASGCAACHCVALSADGRCFSWGRNEQNGQLGHGDTLLRNLPTVVSELSKYNIIAAGVGRKHTVVVTDEGKSFAFGDNKHGQLGTGTVVSPVPCLVTKATNAVCGADFTVWLSSVEGSSILIMPKFHRINTDINTFAILGCAVAADSCGFVYTWGFGGYGRLGHNEQKDEWQPRLVEIFQKSNILGPNDIISAGSASSACTAGGRGQLYMWGKVKNSGDEWMYPKPVMDLSGWNIRCMASGNMHHTVGADDSCISWGHSEYGELGYGPTQKSSVNPKKVDILEGMHVTSVGCGVGMSLIVVDRANVGGKLDQLDTFDGDADAVFQENTKKLYFPPRRNGKGKPNTNTSQHPAVDETEEETSEAEQVTKAASRTTNSRSNKRKKALGHAEAEDEDETGLRVRQREGEKKCSVRRPVATAMDSGYGAVFDMTSMESATSDPVGGTASDTVDELVAVLAQRQSTEEENAVLAPWYRQCSGRERRPR
ncbi:hypothetical protein TRIUR3_07886 [Triticum urartu]|uniref:Protein RCC2 n=1 Tax=Triticum urartu TaxID=4572 RepID=M8A007_TRIUA|nr:hypothetical protein TRIUR3_07886 [Triticum urartu]